MNVIRTIAIVSMCIVFISCGNEDNAMQPTEEIFYGEYLEAYPVGNTPDDTFYCNDFAMLEYTTFSTDSIERVATGIKTTATSYTLILREATASMKIEAIEKTDSTTYETTITTYNFKAGEYDVQGHKIVVSSDCIAVDGERWLQLNNFMWRTTKRKDKTGNTRTYTNTSEYNGKFIREGNTIQNEDYTFNAVIAGNECELTMIKPQVVNIGNLKRK